MNNITQKKKQCNRWNKEDDEKLLKIINESKNLIWKEISNFFDGKFSATQCHQHYYRVIKKKKEKWNSEEDEKLLTLYHENGKSYL
jgi:hypothetical protein